jgi:hypothetical protein
LAFFASTAFLSTLSFFAPSFLSFAIMIGM